MTMTFRCPECDREYRGADRLQGQRVACKTCGIKFAVDGFDEVDEIFAEDQPRTHRRSRQPRSTKSSRKTSELNPVTAICIAGGAGFAIVIVLGVLIFAVTNQLNTKIRTLPVEGLNKVDQLFQYSEIALPAFPDLPSGQLIGTAGVRFSEFQLRGGDQPGQHMTLRVYMPAGTHPDKTLPCVLVGPAGTPLITGNAIDGSDYHDETLPYAEAGAVVMTFSLDGQLDDDETGSAIRNAYLQFRDSAAGLVNCRNALEYAIQKIPAVDPARIVIAGHSSAGSLALLFAEHEPRLAGCIAYCPAADVEARLSEMVNETNVRWLLPGIDEFKKKSAPMTHLAQTRCPVYLFHARDDSNCPDTDSSRYHALLQAAGKTSELKLVDFGGHYDSMIEQGIPSGIEWLQRSQIFPSTNQAQPAKKPSPFVDR